MLSTCKPKPAEATYRGDTRYPCLLCRVCRFYRAQIPLGKLEATEETEKTSPTPVASSCRLCAPYSFRAPFRGFSRPAQQAEVVP